MPELLPGQLQPRLNCAQSNRFACRDLSLTHPFKESQMNYFLLCSGELADHSFQELRQIVVRRLGLVCSELISEFGLPFGFEPVSHPTISQAAPDAVQGPPSG